jgi:hypothetical protein
VRHFRLYHEGIPQVVEETAWCVKGFNAEGVAISGHRGASWVPAQAAKRPRHARPTAVLQPEDVQATQLSAARTYALALTQVSQEQRTTRSRLDAVQQLLQSSV